MIHEVRGPRIGAARPPGLQSVVEADAALASSYRTRVEGELHKICDEILKLLKDCLPC